MGSLDYDPVPEMSLHHHYVYFHDYNDTVPYCDVCGPFNMNNKEKTDGKA